MLGCAGRPRRSRRETPCALALASVAWPTVLVQAAAAAARASNQRSAMPSKGPAGSAAARRE